MNFFVAIHRICYKLELIIANRNNVYTFGTLEEIFF